MPVTMRSALLSGVVKQVRRAYALAALLFLVGIVPLTYAAVAAYVPFILDDGTTCGTLLAASDTSARCADAASELRSKAALAAAVAVLLLASALTLFTAAVVRVRKLIEREAHHGHPAA